MKYYVSKASSTSVFREMKTPNVIYPLKIYSLLLDKYQVKVITLVNYFFLDPLRVGS
jgi:hypothetical protein